MTEDSFFKKLQNAHIKINKEKEAYKSYGSSRQQSNLKVAEEAEKEAYKSYGSSRQQSNLSDIYAAQQDEQALMKERDADNVSHSPVFDVWDDVLAKKRDIDSNDIKQYEKNSGVNFMGNIPIKASRNIIGGDFKAKPNSDNKERFSEMFDVWGDPASWYNHGGTLTTEGMSEEDRKDKAWDDKLKTAKKTAKDAYKGLWELSSSDTFENADDFIKDTYDDIKNWAAGLFK